jgi:exopolysaccharide biosynthesis operon protein EpsL
MPLKHNKRTIPSLAQHLLWCYCFLNLLPNFAAADEFDTLQFNASVNKTWDNNLFRLSNNEISDQITTYTAGVRFDKKYSQQRFLANINYIDYKYQKSDFLDFDTVNYDAAWQWTLTPALTGTLSSARTKTLNGFADFRALIQNIRTEEKNQFRAEYSPHKVWSLIAGFTDTNVENSQTFNAVAGYDATAFDYGARYTFASGTNMTLLGHKRNGNFQRDLIPGALLDNGFSEDEFEFDVVFKATGKSNLTTKLAYLSREYDNFSARDYDAWLGYIRYDILLTGKLKATADLSRTVGAFETGYSTYSEADAFAGSLNYYYSEKLIFAINGRVAQRDFKQPVFANQPGRVDDERNVGGSITWQPIRNVGLILNCTKSSRNSTSAYNSFDYDDVTTSVTLDLKI